MTVKLCQNFVKPIFRGILKSRNPGVRNARKPDALSGRFACARLGETRKRKMDSHFRDCPSWRRYFVTYGATLPGVSSCTVECRSARKIREFTLWQVSSCSFFFRHFFKNCVKNCVKSTLPTRHLNRHSFLHLVSLVRVMGSLSGQYYEPRILLCLIDYIIIIKNRINLFRLYKSIKNNLNAINLS